MSEKSFQIDSIALDHARSMTLHASELRVKNFNFFLVLMGLLVAAFIKLQDGLALLALSGLGAVVCVAFLLLDIRGRELLDAAKRELLDRENSLGISIQKEIADRRRRSIFRKTISHTFVYRILYCVDLILWASLALFMRLR